MAPQNVKWLYSGQPLTCFTLWAQLSTAVGSLYPITSSSKTNRQNELFPRQINGLSTSPYSTSFVAICCIMKFPIKNSFVFTQWKMGISFLPSERLPVWFQNQHRLWNILGETEVELNAQVLPYTFIATGSPLPLFASKLIKEGTEAISGLKEE